MTIFFDAYVFIAYWNNICFEVKELGPVFQSIISLTSPLRGQLVKCFTIFINQYTDIFVEKMLKAFFQQKYWPIEISALAILMEVN